MLGVATWRIWNNIWLTSREETVAAVADALFCLDIDSLKIKEEKKEALTLLSGSENKRISNIKLTITMHTVLIFKEQATFKNKGSTEKGLAQPHYSIQHIERYDLRFYKDN
jgi:hypothetical protein